MVVIYARNNCNFLIPTFSIKPNALPTSPPTSDCPLTVALSIITFLIIFVGLVPEESASNPATVPTSFCPLTKLLVNLIFSTIAPPTVLRISENKPTEVPVELSTRRFLIVLFG